ncbi:recombinase family protein [Pseudomonas sp. NPDC096950]|uniref:recombinase family protein n=1 Tax=Pseudomonas sp. NPDC096950 TaxID=3364485 RepID=UPI00383B2AA8
MNTHIYLRASTKDQDAARAKTMLLAFAKTHGLVVHETYSENISGTTLERPELMRLLDSANKGDVLLVESVDRLSRLSATDWNVLKGAINSKGLRLVIADLPTTHQMFGQGIANEVMRVINAMLIDLMATMARLEQEKRVERIRQGLQNKRNADPSWKPRGKQKNEILWEKVLHIMSKHPNMNAEDVAKLAGCGSATVYRIRKAAAPA